MVRLRKVADEFHHPDEFRPGTMLTWDYLRDMEAYQEYQDGNLTSLYARMSGTPEQDDVTGAPVLQRSGPGRLLRSQPLPGSPAVLPGRRVGRESGSPGG